MKTCTIFSFLILILFLSSCIDQNSSPDLGLALLKEGRSKAVSSHAPEPDSNYDRLRYIRPGETAEIFNVKGAGVINHIWLTFNESRPNWLEAGGSANPAELVLRMYWDGATDPTVESPLGDFFGAGFGLRNEIRSQPLLVEGGDGYNSYWQMPFHQSARITVTNEGKKAARSFYYQIDFTDYKKLPKNTAYFCAQYRQEFPEKTGNDYLIADIEGKGAYVGTIMSARSRSPYWFGEGDAKFYIDGEKEPSIWGTGTEDYFLCAWGLNKCLFPFFGCTYMSAGEEDLGVRYSLYRFHMPDPVRFTRSLRFEIEHKGWMPGDETKTGKDDGHVEREDDMATVAIWYQQGQPKRFTTLPPCEERVLPDLDFIIGGKEMIGSVRHSPGKAELQKGYDWTGEGQIFFIPETVKAWLEADFNIEFEEYRGLILKMTNASDYGIYKVYIDGKPISRVPMTIDFEKDKPAGEARILDLYSKNVEVKDYYLGSSVLKKGKHTIRFEQVGQNGNSTGNYLGFDSFRLMKRWNKKRISLLPATVK